MMPSCLLICLSLLPACAPVSDEDIDYRVPNVIQIADDGSVVPVNYELKDEDEADFPV
jgi:hypothetical protein